MFTRIHEVCVLLALVLTTNVVFSFESDKYTCNPTSTKQEKIFDVEKEDVLIIKSLVDSSTITNFIKKNYAFNEPIKSKILNIGVNDMYLVEAEEKYVLRLSRVDKYLTMTPSEFKFELEWLEFLNQNNVPVSYPIRRTNHQLYGVINAPEGPRYATLFSYAEGSTDMNEEQAFILGQSLAHLHTISDNFETQLSREHLDLAHLIDQPLKQIKEFLGESSLQKEISYLEDLADELKKQISNIDATDGVYGIIAGDMHGYNQHFTIDDQLTMFDFEFCSYGYRIYDLATFKWGRGSDDVNLWDSFLKGYQSIRKLNDSELQAVDVFVKARNLWWMGSICTMVEYEHKLNGEFWESAFSRFQFKN